MTTENYIPLHILEAITDGFSERSRIGRGGYGDVYKGVYNKREIAVKLLQVDALKVIDDQQFKNEFVNLLEVKHRNIVQLVGYCYETKKMHAPDKGVGKFSERIYRVLCFEYLQGGSLDKHLKEQSFAPNWSTRYNIIKGICEGLNFLHGREKRILHLDLKPANILLDSSMVPKVADFGLSRLFDGSHTRITKTIAGTKKYMPPEFTKNGMISDKNDVFSLGVVMLDIMAAYAGYSNSFEIDDVPQLMQQAFKISNNLIEDKSGAELHQVETCINLAARCVDHEKKNRPTMAVIVATLNETEFNISNRQGVYNKREIAVKLLQVDALKVIDDQQFKNEFVNLLEVKHRNIVQLVGYCYETKKMHAPDKEAGETSSEVSRETTELLDIRPIELRFPFEPNKLITCPLYLTNNTDHQVAFTLQPQGQKDAEMYYHGWLCGAVPPKSTYTLNVTMKERSKPHDNDVIMIIMSSIISDDKLDQISKKKELDIPFYNFFSEVKQKGIDKVHQVMLKAVCDPQEATRTEIITMTKYNKIGSMDVHPTQPLIITSRSTGHFRIWNYETKSLVYKITKEQEKLACDVLEAKFVVRQKWVVAGGGDGCIHVYDSNTMQKVMSLKTHRAHITALAIHPTKPYVLATSNDWEIEMWDWENGLTSARTFKGHKGSVYQIAFDPENPNSFATVSQDKKVKIWSLDSSDHITMEGHTSKVRCLHYFRHADHQYLITGSDDGTAKIWDLQIKCCVQTLQGHTKRVSTVCSHPMLPLLMTGSLDGTVRLWDSNSFRLKGILNFGLEEVNALERIMDGSGRVAIGYSCGLAILAHEDVASSTENTM